MISKSQTLQIRIPRWHRIYYAMALLVAFAIAASIFTNYRVVNEFNDMVDYHLRWERVKVLYGHLDRELANIDTPGNRVFESHNLSAEARALERSVLDFVAVEEEAHRAIEALVSQDRAAVLIQDLKKIHLHVDEMLAHSKDIFRLYGHNNISAAAKAMSAMDSAYANARHSLVELRGKSRALQNERIERQAVVNHERQFSQMYLSVVIIAIALYLLGYGRRMAGRMNKSVRDAEEYRAALDATSIVATTDIRGKILSVNDKFCEISGYSRAELLGQDHRILNSGAHPKEFFAEMWSTIKEGRIWRGEIQNRSKSGSVYWVDSMIIPILNEFGEVKKFRVIRFDISERKRSEMEMRKLKALADNSADFIGLCTLEGQVMYVNPAGVRLTGDKAVSSAGRTEMLNYLLPQSRERFLAEVLPIVKAAGSWSGELQFQNVQTHDPIDMFVNLFKVSDETTGRSFALGAVGQDIREQKKNLAALAKNKERLNLTLESTGDGIWDWDVITGYVTFSKRWSDILGYEENEIYPHGSSWAKLLHDEDRERVMTQLRQHLAGRTERFDVEHRFRCKNGSYAWVRSRGRVVARDAQNRAIRMVGTTQDITESKALRLQQERLTQILENSTDFIATVRPDLGVTYLNPALRRAVGLQNYPTENIHASDLHPAEALKELAATAIPTASQGGIWHGETYILGSGGKKIPVSQVIIAHPGADGNPAYFSTIMRDISAQRRALQAMERAQETALENARMKSQFIANVSHEIRTPMNGILGMARLLRETPLNSEQNSLVSTIQHCGDTLLALINDILDFSKVESGKMKLEAQTFHLPMCVEEALSLVSVGAREKKLLLGKNIDKSVNEWFVGDATRIRQVLVNLLANAIKFTPEGEVHLSVTQRRLAQGRLELQFSVRDTGIGISPEQESRLFQVFTQADVSTTRKFGGTGLGLAICKTLCEMMGGRIWVKSQLGRGSVFSFTVIGEEGQAIAQETEKEQALAIFQQNFAEKHPMRILVAEDNPVNQRLAASFLSKMGYTVQVVENGNEVLSKLAQEDFDLILMDVHMPELDGIEATRRLRVNPNHSSQRVYIVAMTAGALAGDREACLAAGMNDYLSKPIIPSELVGALTDAYRTLHPQPSRSLEELLRIHFMGDMDLLRESFDIFLKTYAGYLSDIDRAISAQDSSALEHAAHTLKGSLRNFGFVASTTLAADLELMGRKANFQNGPQALQALRHQVNMDIEALRSQLQQKRVA